MIKHLTPAFLSELTDQNWINEVIRQLGDATVPGVGLIGVDIGHVDLPEADLVVSKPCVGFVSCGPRIEATCMNCQPAERVKYDRIEAILSSSFAHSRMTHWALCDKNPQVNTLVFWEFTLAYSYDFNLPKPERAASIRPRLILHGSANRLDPRTLSACIQTCLNSFTQAHDDMRALQLVAPAPYALASTFGAAPAGL